MCFSRKMYANPSFGSLVFPAWYFWLFSKSKDIGPLTLPISGKKNPPRYRLSVIWLVVWNIFYFPIYWESSSQLWLIFFRGVAQPPTSDELWYIPGLVSPSAESKALKHKIWRCREHAVRWKVVNPCCLLRDLGGFVRKYRKKSTGESDVCLSNGHHWGQRAQF